MPVCIAVFYQKKFISMGATYIVELIGNQLSIMYAGSAMADCNVRVGRTNTDPWNHLSLERGVGQMVANKMVAGYTKVLDANIESYNQGGREALMEHKSSRTFDVSEIVEVRVLDKPGSWDPAAIKGHTSGLIEFDTKSGKRWRMAIRKVDRDETEQWAERLRGNRED